MTNQAYEATESDVEKVEKKKYPSDNYLNEILTNTEFAAVVPIEAVRCMAREIMLLRTSSPNGMMQLSNELAEMKQKCAELKASHHDLRESMAAIHNTIRGNGAYVSLSVLLTASENAWSKSASAEAITVESNDVITCWSCKKSMTALERSSADGFCPHCNAEIDTDEDQAAGGTVEGSE